MARKALKLVLALLMLFGTAGCWDALNIDDRDIITTVVVDYKDGEYTFYCEVANIVTKQSASSEPGQNAGSTVVKGTGKSFAEARTDLDNKLEKPIFLGAVQALIITERMAEHGIEEYILRVRQMQEYRKTMDVVITADDPEEFLKIQAENQPFVGFAVESSLQTMKQQGETFHISLADLLERQSSQNPCYLLSTISVASGQVTVTGYTIFCDGKRQGFIPYREARGTIFIAAGQESTPPKFDYVIPYNNKQFTLQAQLDSVDIKAHYDGTAPGFDISLRFCCNSLYPSECLALSKEAKEALEQGLEQQLCQEVAETIKQSQQYCDYLLFNETFRIQYPDIYEKMNWEEEYRKAWFSIKVNAEVLDNDTIDYNPRERGE